MPRQADKFFKYIWDARDREVDVEFDLYYFCFIAGIATGCECQAKMHPL